MMKPPGEDLPSPIAPVGPGRPASRRPRTPRSWMVMGGGLGVTLLLSGLGMGQDHVGSPEAGVSPAAGGTAAVGGTAGTFLGAWDVDRDGEGLLFGLGLMALYDSNLYLGDGNEVDDFVFSAIPWMRYSSAPPGGALWIFNARYAPAFRKYVDQSNLDSIDHSGGLSLSYDGAVARFEASARYAEAQQANRFVGTQADTEQFNFEARGSYVVSDVSSLEADMGYSDQTTTSVTSSQVETATVSASLLWEATPLVRLGPTMRFSRRDSDTIGNSEALGLLVTADYELTGLTKLRASAGIERVTGDRINGSDVNPTGSLALDYRAPDQPWSLTVALDYGEVQQASSSDRYGGGGESPWSGLINFRYEFAEHWGMALAMRYETFPSPDGTSQSVNDLAWEVSVGRELGQGAIRTGVTFSRSEYESLTGVPARPDQDNMDIFAQCQVPIFDERANLQSSVRYADNSGGQEWSRWQIVIGLNCVF